MPQASLVLWLFLGASLNLFSGGRWTIPAAAWLAPVFLLHSARLQDPVVGMLALALVLFATIFWAYRGLIPASGPALALISALIALASLVPFLADRLIVPRIPGYASTLVFPLTWAVVDFAAARLSPYGTWGSVAYSQYGNLPLMQLSSVTGTAGIAFLIAWFASTLNWAWDRNFEWESVRGGLTAYAFVWSFTMILGGARLAFGPVLRKSVRVAAVGWPEGIVSRDELMGALAADLAADERAKLGLSFERIRDYFLEASRREARAGARIVVWPEANAIVFHDDQAAFVERARQMARDEAIYLLMGMAVLYPGAARPFENRAALIDPAGAVALSYVKGIPVPGFEARMSRRGERRLLSHDSPHGRIAVAICYDLDFPGFVRQVGTAGADLLLVPASDWEAIKLSHHVSAVFRAVENGVAMVRATRWGLSAAVDPQGRVLALVDSFTTADQTLVAEVPVRGVRTLYARFGDWFAWLCVAGLLCLLAWSLALAGQQA